MTKLVLETVLRLVAMVIVFNTHGASFGALVRLLFKSSVECVDFRNGNANRFFVRLLLCSRSEMNNRRRRQQQDAQTTRRRWLGQPEAAN